MKNNIPSSLRTTFVVISLISCTIPVRAKVSPSNTTSQGWGHWSQWSPCSSTCEVELSQRSRSCQASQSSAPGALADSLCKGTEKQYKVCEKQKCIGSTRDYRKEECDKQVHVPFRGRRYHWDPFIDPRDQCHLTCKARRYGFTISLGRPVKNGVPCKGDSPDSVCLYGRCQTVGCDGVVGSSARQDHCGVCGGDNESCRIIAGIFTRRHLSYGYNRITRIPRGSCHVNVTELARSRNYLVLRYSNGTSIINGDRADLKSSGSYYAAGTTFRYGKMAGPHCPGELLKYSNGTSIINGDRADLKSSGSYYAAGTTFRYGKMAGPHCPGECVYAEGPLTDDVHIELLSYRHNKGIKYMFTIPKNLMDSVLQTFQRPPTTSQGRHRGTRVRHHQGANNASATATTTAGRQINYNQQPEYISPDSPGRDAYGYQALTGNKRKISTQEVINRYRQGQGYKQTQVESPSLNQINSNAYNNRGVPLSSNSRTGTNYNNNVQQGNNGYASGSGYDRNSNYIDQVPLAKPLQPSYRQPGTGSRGNSNSGYGAPQGSGTSRLGNSGSVSRGQGQTAYNRQYPSQTRGVNYNTYNRNIVSNRREELIVPDTIDEINFHWTISGFTECSRTCGGGRQDTIMTCMKRKTNVQVTDANCDPAKKKLQTIVCNKSPCPPGWEDGPWSLCSVTCGQGVQTRRVECKQRYSENVSHPVTAQRCDISIRPPTSQSCQTKPCADWQTGNWSKCSVECGIGDMSRSVDCVDTEGKRVPVGQCAGFKPERSRRCDMGTCAKGWFQTAWSDSCSTDCGPGFHTRTVYCSAEDGSPLPETKCGAKPRTEKPCKKTRPCGGFWFEGPWSKCKARCGVEVQRRDVVCMKKLDNDLFAVVGPANCREHTKPQTQRPCPALPGCPPHWFMTKWSECSKSCGVGVKTRDVKCLADDDKSPSSSCRPQDKPPLRRTCNVQECDLPQLDEDPGCKDHWNQCRLVVQARLCPYKYYKEKCCHSCTLHHLKHKQEKHHHTSS